MPNPNDQYKIFEFETSHERVSVYVLKPGQNFERFGGSRHGLTVVKTPSLIIRTHSLRGHGTQDVEHDVHNINVWRTTLDAYRVSVEDKNDS